MSRMWRTRQQPLVAATPQEAGNDQAWSGELDFQYPAPSAEFPGPRETRFVDAQNHEPRDNWDGIGSIHDDIDWEVGGIQGLTKGSYTTGVVESTNVDAHDYDGGQAVIRRMRDTNFGAVGTADYNSTLALIFEASESDQYFPNEQSQADLVMGV